MPIEYTHHNFKNIFLKSRAHHCRDLFKIEQSHKFHQTKKGNVKLSCALIKSR